MKHFLKFQTLLCILLSTPGWPRDIPAPVQERLERAQRDLAVSEAAARRVQGRLEVLKADPVATPEQIEAMEAYLKDVQAMVSARRRTLNELKERAGEPLEAPAPEVLEGMNVFEQAVDGVPDAEDPETEAARLEREFEASLEEFDADILAYNRKLEADTAAIMARGDAAAGERAGAAAEAADLLRSMGVDPGTGAAEGGTGESTGEVAGTSPQTEGSTSGRESSGGRETAGTDSAGGSTSEGSAGGSTRPPPSEDEDIVARQLREAAEKETDPELKEKLWKEYEAYLDGRS